MSQIDPLFSQQIKIMINSKTSNSTNIFCEITLLLVAMFLCFDGGQFITATTAIRQEVDGAQLEQFTGHPSEVEKPLANRQTNPISSFFPLTSTTTSLREVLYLVESISLSEAPLPGFGQVIVSFLAKSRTDQKTSDKPHHFSC